MRHFFLGLTEARTVFGLDGAPESVVEALDERAHPFFWSGFGVAGAL